MRINRPFSRYKSLILIIMSLLIPLTGGAGDVDMRHLQELLDQSDRLAQASPTAPTNSSNLALSQQAPPKRILVDVRSNHSDGAHTIPTLIAWAKKRGIEALALTEHDRFSIRLGIDPIPQILGYSQQHPSLYTTGIDPFFTELHAERLNHPEIQLFAGTESTPGYHWSGIPFKNLTLHNAERHIITLGIETPAQVKALTSYELPYGLGNRTISTAFWFSLMFVMVMIFLLRRNRGMALLMVAAMTAFMATWLMKPKVDADAAFIASAQQQALFTIWAHPGTLSGVRPGPMGVMLDTPSYNQRVFQEPTADAFAAVYGDTDLNTIAGGLWDRYMMDYLHGHHAKPIWATAAGDYHEEGMAHEYLGNFPMDVWSDSTQPTAILNALKSGHMVAWGMGKESNIYTRELYLQDAQGKRVKVGDEASVQSPVQLVVALGNLTQSGIHTPQSLQGQWIVDGKIVGHSSVLLDDTSASSRTIPLSQGAHVIRFQINQGVRMVANPFLVHVK